MSNKPTRSLIKSSAKMAVATFSSRILGLVRELAMASVFGASGSTDAFLVAYRIPNVLRDLFAEGNFSPAFVPIFTEVNQKSKEEARKLMWSVFILLGLITALLSAGIIIFSEELVTLFAPKFALLPEKLLLTSTMLKIMAPFLVVISWAALFMGVLNTLKIFFAPSFAPVFFNIIMILAILVAPPYFERNGVHGIIALAFGVILGGLAQAAIQLPLILKQGFYPTKNINLISKNTKKIINRVGIGTIGVAATQINLLINTVLATGTVVGAVSWLTYAFRLFQFPVGILGVSLAGSNLVHFSDAWKAGRLDEAKSYLKTSYILSFLVITPAFVLLHQMAYETISLILERGAFTGRDTEMTATALKFYAVGLPFYGLYKIFGPIFYTLDKPIIPIIISVISIGVNITFCVILTPIYGFTILALGISLSMAINATAQAILLKKLLDLPLSFFLDIRLLKIGIAGAVSWFTTSYLVNVLYNSSTFITKITTFTMIGLGGALSYAAILVILGESSSLKKLLTKIKK